MHRVKRVGNYAPISAGRPVLVTIASAYFMLGGAAVAIHIIFTMLMAPELLKGQLTTIQFVLNIALTLAWAGGLFWTGSLLADQSRRGAYYALCFTALSLITSFDAPTVVISVMSIAVLASIWKKLE